MSLPGSGTLAASQVNGELGRASNAPFSFGDAAVRALAGAPSGPISMAQLRGKSAYTPMQATANNIDDSTDANNPSPYTGSWSPGVSVSGGNASKTITWAFIDNAGGFTLTVSNGSVGTVTHLVPKFGFAGTCILRATISDGTTTITCDVYVTITSEF